MWIISNLPDRPSGPFRVARITEPLMPALCKNCWESNDLDIITINMLNKISLLVMNYFFRHLIMGGKIENLLKH